MKALTVIVCCYVAIASHAQVLCKWNADSSSAVAAEFQCYRGETLQFQPTLKQYGSVISNASYTLYYQTNGMGTAYWSTNILKFTPSMDVGASAYTVFIRAETTNGISYRANAKIKMLGSPGATPNVLPLPAQTIDFSAISYSNAPWLLSADLGPIQGRLESVEGSTNAWNAAAAWGNHAAAGYLSASIWLTWIGTNTYVKAESDPTVPDHVKSITQAEIDNWNNSTSRVDVAFDSTKLVSVDSNHFVCITATNLVMYEITFTQVLDSSQMKLTVSEDLYANQDLWPETVMMNAGTYYMPMSPYEWEYYAYSLSTNSSDGVSWSIAGLGAGPNDSWLTIVCAPPREYYDNQINFNPEYQFSDYPLTLNLSAAGFVGYSGNASMVLSRVYFSVPVTNAIKTFATLDDSLGMTPIQVTNVVRTIIHTNQIWASPGTNALYQMSWDATNGTWAVQEILP